MKRFSLVLVAIATMLLFSSLAFATDDGNFSIGIANSLPATDTIVTLSNSGSSWGQPFPGITGGIDTIVVPPSPVVFIGNGNLCANVYVFSFDEQEQACCTCPMSPNSIHNLSTVNDLISNTLTGAHPGSVEIKIVASEQDPTRPGTCNATNVNLVVRGIQIGQPLAGGLLAWGRRTDSNTEVAFTSSSLSSVELARLTGLCGAIVGNGSGHGICNTCHNSI